MIVPDKDSEGETGFGQEREEVLGGLCEHLRLLGVKATVLDWDSLEAVREPFQTSLEHSPTDYGGGLKIVSVLGCVRIEDRNLDMILVQRTRQPEMEGAEYHERLSRVRTVYSYYYVTRADVDGLSADFKGEWHDRARQGYRVEERISMGKPLRTLDSGTAINT